MKKALWASLALLVVLILPGGLIGAFVVWAWNWRRVRGMGAAVDNTPSPPYGGKRLARGSRGRTFLEK